jgi:hypothetical protein
LLFAYPCFAIGIQGCQDAPVFPKCVINIPYIIHLIAVLAVVVGVAALIAAEFLINPALDRIITFKTSLFFHIIKEFLPQISLILSLHKFYYPCNPWLTFFIVKIKFIRPATDFTDYFFQINMLFKS